MYYKIFLNAKIKLLASYIDLLLLLNSMLPDSFENFGALVHFLLHTSVHC